VLGHYVRELKVMTWQEAVRNMTLLPATTIGMVDRGGDRPWNGRRRHSVRWASVTAAVRWGSDSQYRPMVVIVDDADPQRGDQKPILRIVIDGVTNATRHPASPHIRIGRR
jgi:hypothetical protein